MGKSGAGVSAAVPPKIRFSVAYLDPPPFPAPVIVTKDVGGYVSDYQAQTARYRAEGREVRLHECRSACTLALSLPNVCVYPSSLLKFHKAYNANTREADENVSAMLFRSYPAAVQARLGGLTREYRVLTGSELIALGLRNCNDGATQVARAGARQTAPAPQEEGLFGKLAAAFQVKPAEPAVDPAPVGSLRTARPRRYVASPREMLEVVEEADVPLPPRRPPDLQPLPEPGLPRLISGAQQALSGSLKAAGQLFRFNWID